jgi:hypothetical protein
MFKDRCGIDRARTIQGGLREFCTSREGCQDRIPCVHDTNGKLAQLQAMILNGGLRRNNVEALLMEPQIVALIQPYLQIGSEVAGA